MKRTPWRTHHSQRSSERVKLVRMMRSASRSVVAETAPQYLFFESQGGRSPMLHYGAEHTPLPRYDLQRRTRIAAITNAPVLELGKAKSNPLKVASGLASYIHTMIVIAVAIVFCAILYVLLRTIRPRLR